MFVNTFLLSEKRKRTFPRNRLDQHFGDFVLNVCEKTMDQLNVNADAKLNTLCRRRPFGVKLQIERSTFKLLLYFGLFRYP